MNDIKKDNATKKIELEIKKLKKEVKNLKSDEKLSWFEKKMKKRFVPLILPLLTFIATGSYFLLGYYKDERSKAFERYKVELELVKNVWGDVNYVPQISSKSIVLDSIILKNKKDIAVNYLRKIDIANIDINIEDSSKIGIKPENRPIAILRELIPEMKASFSTHISDESTKGLKPELVKNNDSSIVSQRPKLVSKISETTKNSDLYTIYLQYYFSISIEKSLFVKEQLIKLAYIIPEIEKITIFTFDNQVRYYSKNDSLKAVELVEQLKKVTGCDFKPKYLNLERYKSKKIIEVWYGEQCKQK